MELCLQVVIERGTDCVGEFQTDRRKTPAHAEHGGHDFSEVVRDLQFLILGVDICISGNAEFHFFLDLIGVKNDIHKGVDDVLHRDVTDLLPGQIDNVRKSLRYRDKSEGLLVVFRLQHGGHGNDLVLEPREWMVDVDDLR